MPSLRERLDVSSITVNFLPLPKGRKRAAAIGFCGSDPIATVEGPGNSAPPWRWVHGKPEQLTFQDVRKIGASGSSPNQVAGLWYTPNHDERALVWTRNGDAMRAVELHPDKWQKSNAVACSDGQQIGYGYVKFAKDPCRALLWNGSRESLIVLTGPDPSVEVMGNGVSAGVQVGTYGGSVRKHACMWRGSAGSFIDLHPDGSLVGSDATAAGDGQQVGIAWDEELAGRAALWSGSSETFRNLGPDGFVRSHASHCARGFQAGWVARKDRGMLIRAALWNGAAEDWLDLQDFLPDPWTASWVRGLYVSGDRLLILGTAQQAVMSGGYEVNAGQVPVIWEGKLRIAEEPAARDADQAVQASILIDETAPSPSRELQIAKAVEDFGQAIVKRDFKTARSMLAPWLQKQVTAKKLQAIIEKHMISDDAPEDCTATGNDSTLDDMRYHYREYYKDDTARTLATTEDFGEWGPPSIVLAKEITPDNFLQWMWIDFTPDPGSGAMVDYCLRLYIIAVNAGDGIKIGHLEPGD
jgi:hypothetical protein